MGQRLDQRTALAVQPADGDLFHVVDVSDTTDNANGSSKKITYINLVPDASTTVEGKVELATDAETITGTDTARAVTPSNVTAKMDTDGTLAGNSDTRIPSQKAVKTYGDRALNTTLNIHPIYAPQGFLINGKISVTDTGSGLNVALKTLAGTDPSSTDPIYVRLNDSVRTISQAISVTMADGTNWFNAGSAELATKEIDYFVYLIWNSANSRVSIAVSRIPYYKNWSEVTDSNTSERNFEYDSNFGSAVANDECEVVGRFAATLSAGAGYTWSVPTFTAENLIQRPIYETRNLSWLPTYSASSSMTWTSVTTTSATYKLTGKVCDIFFRAIGTTGGTASTELRFSIPVSTTDTNLTGCGNTADTSFQGGGATYFVSAAVIGVVKQAVANWGLGALRRCETNMRFPI